MPGTYKISIPTKPYLKKYLENLYGNKIIISPSNYLGITIISLLERGYFEDQYKDFLKYRQFNKYDVKIDLHLPKWYLKNSHFGTGLSKENVILINRHFEERFTEELCYFTKLMALSGIEMKNSIEWFCSFYNIEIDCDITSDAVKKKEYRKRMQLIK